MAIFSGHGPREIHGPQFTHEETRFLVESGKIFDFMVNSVRFPIHHLSAQIALSASQLARASGCVHTVPWTIHK